jgi:hypothetical protein
MPAWPFIVPFLSIAVMTGRPCRWPISKSVASWPGACAEGGIDGFVGDHPHAPLDERDEHLFADERLPARVVGMHRHGRVRDDRLRPRGRDDHVRRARGHLLGPGIAHVRQLIRARDVEQLEVRERGLAGEAPVDDAVSAIQMAVPVLADEMRPHPALHVRIHREVHAGPVERAPQHAQLTVDAWLVMLHPLPHLAEELIPRQTLPVGLLRELLLHDDLRDDPGVVGAGQVERGVAPHPVPPRHQVLIAAEPQRVAHVEVAGHVREGQHHHELLLVGRRCRRWREEARPLPPVVEIRLDDRGPEVLLVEVEHRGWRLPSRVHRSSPFASLSLHPRCARANKKRCSSQDEQRRRTTRASRTYAGAPHWTSNAVSDPARERPSRLVSGFFSVSAGFGQW